MGLGNNTSLDDNVRAGAAQLFVAPAMRLSEGDEQCAHPQPATHRLTPTEQPRSEAVFFSDTPLATHCASSHYTPQIHWLARCEVTDSLTKAAWTVPAVRPRSKSAPRDTHALGHAPLQRQTRPLVGGVSCPLQWVPFLLAMPMTLPLPPSAAAARTEAAAEAVESVEAAAGAMEAVAVVTAEAPAAAELEEVEAEAEADAAEAVTAVAAAATAEPVATVEPEPEPIVAEAELGMASGAGARVEEAGRRPTRRWYDYSLHALFSSFALLSSMSLSPLLLLGLLLAGAVSRAARTPRPLLHGCRARNSKVSKVSRTGIGPMRRWLILGWLAVASGFRLPEENSAVAQIDAGVNPLSPHESTITGEVDGAHDRRQLASGGSSCNGDWYDSPPRLFVPPLRNPANVSLFAATQQRGEGPVIVMVGSAVVAIATHIIRPAAGPARPMVSSAGCTTTVTTACATSPVPCRMPSRRHAR